MWAQRNLDVKLPAYLIFYKAENTLHTDVLGLPWFTGFLEEVVLALLQFRLCRNFSLSPLHKLLENFIATICSKSICEPKFIWLFYWLWLEVLLPFLNKRINNIIHFIFFNPSVQFCAFFFQRDRRLHSILCELIPLCISHKNKGYRKKNEIPMKYFLYL